MIGARGTGCGDAVQSALCTCVGRARLVEDRTLEVHRAVGPFLAVGPKNDKASRSTGGAMRGRKASKPAPGAGGCSILWSTSLAVVAEASRAGRGWRPAVGPDSHSGTEWSNWCSFVNFVRPPWSSLSTLGNESNDRSSIPLVRPETRSEGSGSEGSGELLPGAQVVSRCPLRDTVGPAARSARASTLPSHEPDVQTHRKPFGCQVSSRAERLHAQFHVPRMSFA